MPSRAATGGAGQPREAGPGGVEPSLDELRVKAADAIARAANTLRAVGQRYRGTLADEVARWIALRAELDAIDRRPAALRPRLVTDDPAPGADAAAAEATLEDVRARELRTQVHTTGSELSTYQTEMTKLQIALKSLETTWVFLERGDRSLVLGHDEPFSNETQMRIVEAQEAERTRLAQEVHDGPAQVLSNAIFQVEYIERVVGDDEALARTELRFLREMLRRELGAVRTFMSQLRPPVLDELGLDGAIADAIARTTGLSGIATTTDLDGPADALSETQQTVALRIVQEALQNIRKHGGATAVTVATRLDGPDWVVSVRDNGRGFDVGAVASRGRRNFGLQFMKERAELIGARFEVESRPDRGTLVRLSIPVGAKETS